MKKVKARRVAKPATVEVDPRRLVGFLALLTPVLAAIVAHQELFHLFKAVSQPWHSGSPPQPVMIGGCLIGLLAAIAIARQLLLRRTVPLWLSAFSFAGFVAVIAMNGFEPRQRSAPGGNLAVIDQVKVLHEQLNQALQHTNTVPMPVGVEAWRLAGVSPFRDRLFRAQPWLAVAIATEETVPQVLVPGSILAAVSDDRVTFSLFPVGIDDDGHAVKLVDDGKQPIVFRGAFNPDTPR